MRKGTPGNAPKLISLTLLAGGALLLFIGIGATSSSASDLSRLANDTATRDAMWMLVGGAAASVVGLAGMLSRSGQA